MDICLFRIGVVTSLLAFAGVSYAQPTRCQCTDEQFRSGQRCAARVTQEGNWFTITSDNPRCSRVDWYIDGEPKVTIVKDGSEDEEWLGSSRKPRTEVSSCHVCSDRKYDSQQGAPQAPRSEAEISDGKSNWIADSKGCKAFNESPAPGETVTWTGGCVGGFMEGQGVFQFHQNGAPGSRYEGTMRRGYLFGSGIFRQKDGIIIEANWANSQPVTGKVTYLDGAWYDGEWKNWKSHGRGTLYYPDGTRFEGTFNNGEGIEGVDYLPNGTRFKVQNGERGAQIK